MSRAVASPGASIGIGDWDTSRVQTFAYVPELVVCAALPLLSWVACQALLYPPPWTPRLWGEHVGGIIKHHSLVLKNREVWMQCQRGARLSPLMPVLRRFRDVLCFRFMFYEATAFDQNIGLRPLLFVLASCVSLNHPHATWPVWWINPWSMLGEIGVARRCPAPRW